MKSIPKRLFPVLAFFSLFSLACQSNKDTYDRIVAMEEVLTQRPSEDTMRLLLGLYQEMLGSTLSDSQKINFLWKTSEMARGLQQYELSEESLMKIYEGFPESDYAPKALFLHAFILDEDRKDFNGAEFLYKSFLEKYPESDFADDAQFLLTHLGKSDEEMLRILSGQDMIQDSVQ